MPVHPIRDTDNVVEIGKCDPSGEDMRETKERIEKTSGLHIVSYRNMGMKDTDRAYLAGLIDGEGCISISYY